MNTDALSMPPKSNRLLRNLPPGRKLFKVTHRDNVTSEQLIFSLMLHYRTKKHFFAAFTLPDMPDRVFIETSASQGSLEEDLSHLKSLKCKTEDISSNMNDIYPPFKSVPLRPGRVVILLRPDFQGEIGQIVDLDAQNGTVLVKCLPHIDYANLRKHDMDSQQKLSAKMPRDYRAPRVPFKQRASPGARSSSITIHGCKQPCVEWDTKKFIGRFQYVWMKIDEVSPKSSVDLSSVDLSTLAASVTSFESEHPGFMDEMLNRTPRDYETERSSLALMKYTGKSVNHPARSQSRSSSCSSQTLPPETSSQDISRPMDIIEISSIEDSLPPPPKSEVTRQPRSVKPVLASASDSMTATPSQFSCETQWCGPGIIAAKFFDPNQMTPADVELRRSDRKGKDTQRLRICPALDMDSGSPLEQLPYSKFEHTAKQLSSPPKIFDEPLKAPTMQKKAPPTFTDFSSSDPPKSESTKKKKSPRDVKKKKIVMSREMQSKISMMAAEAHRDDKTSDTSDNHFVSELRRYREERQARSTEQKSPQTSPIRHVAPKPVLETTSQKLSIRERMMNISSSSESASFDFNSDSDSSDSLRKYVEIEKPRHREVIGISSDSD